MESRREKDDDEEEKKRKANKKRQKDIDAYWVKKGGEKHYGYKNHANMDKESKFIKKGVTTDASAHNSKPAKELVDEKDRGEDLFSDSTYISKRVKMVMRKFGMKDNVIKRNTRGKKISIWQETINRKNSKLRVRVEYVFEFMEESLHRMSSRVVGFARNAAFNTLTNLVYNLFRYEQAMRLGTN